MRRSLGLGGKREYGDEGGGEDVDEFGNRVPDFSGPNYPRPFVDYEPTEVAGNTEPGKPFPGTPTTFGPRTEAPPGPSGPSVSQPGPANTPSENPPAFNLPQGVSVNEGMFSGASKAGNSFDTPAMSMEPNPTAEMTPNPAFGQPEGGTSRGPMRRSAQSPAIYAQSATPGLSGRAGGLMGGGLGAVGQGEPSGPISPTEMFQKLLQMFKQG